MPFTFNFLSKYENLHPHFRNPNENPERVSQITNDEDDEHQFTFGNAIQEKV